MMGIVAGVILMAVVVVVAALKQRHIDVWLLDYWRQKRNREVVPDRTTHVLFCFVDHFEPKWGGAGPEQALERVSRWVRDYPRVCEGHLDADGCKPKHTFFFPEEEYEPEYLEQLSALCKEGFGEVEIHLHHDDDTAENFTSTLKNFVELLRSRHGLIGENAETSELSWGFIHGNWALDNSLPDGSWCGINNEITLLREIGCYADFTLPSAPSPAQTRTVNRIYYAEDDPEKPKSHDTGHPVSVGRPPSGDLMIVQGVLALNWASRKFGVIPRIENSDIRSVQPPTASRVKQWVETGVSVVGKPEWVVIKIHTHGTVERDMPTLLGEPMKELFECLETKYNDGEKYALHYVSSRELYNIIKAAEAGLAGDPGEYRDYVITPPPYKGN